MGKPITDWEVETGGTLGVGAEQSPVVFPRSEADRSQSNNNKGGASVDAGPGVVAYGVGAYPSVDEEADDNEGGQA